MTDTAHYEFFEHTADIGLNAWGATLDDAFVQAAYGMFAIITDDHEVRGKKTHRFRIEADDIESLLVRFLTQLLIIHESEDVVLGDFQVTLDGRTRLDAVCRSEPFDESRHGGGVHVKAISYHMMEIDSATAGRPAHLKILFDI